MKLIQCVACSRHVKADEAMCPFCGASTGPSVVKLVGGLAIAAAAVALTATSLGCAYGIAVPERDSGTGNDTNESR